MKHYKICNSMLEAFLIPILKSITNQIFLNCLLSINFALVSCTDEIFIQDIGKDMKIGLAESGYKSVKLRCGSNSIHVEIEINEEFSGVIYTRGSFDDKESPCFLDPGDSRGQQIFKITFPFDKCKTIKIGELYTNVLVVQYDKELIMPGDAAFKLECDFHKPRDILVSASLNNSPEIVSRITLTDADPGVKTTEGSARFKVENDSSTIEFTPKDIKGTKKIEL